MKQTPNIVNFSSFPQNQQLSRSKLISSSPLSVPSQPCNMFAQPSTLSSRLGPAFLVQQQQAVYRKLNYQYPHYGLGDVDSARKNAGTIQWFDSHPGSFLEQPLQGMQATGIMGSQNLSSQQQSIGSQVYEMQAALMREKLAQYCQNSETLNPQQLSQPSHQQPTKGLQQQQSQSLLLQRHQQPPLQKMPENTSQKVASLMRLEANVTASNTNISGGGLRQETKATDQFHGERETCDLVHEVDLCGDLGLEIEELLLGITDDFFNNVDTWENLDFDAEYLLSETVDDLVNTQHHQQWKQQLPTPLSQQHQQPGSQKLQGLVLQQEHFLHQHQQPEFPKIQEHDGQKTVTSVGLQSNVTASSTIIPAEVSNQGAKATKQLLGKRKTQELQHQLPELPKIQEHASQQHQRLELPKIEEHVSQQEHVLQQHEQAELPKIQEHVLQQHQQPVLPKIQERQKSVTLAESLSNWTASRMIIPAKLSNQGAKATKQLLGKRKSEEFQQQQLRTPVSQQHQELELPKRLGHGCQVRRVYDISALFEPSNSVSNNNRPLMSKKRPVMSSSLGLKQLLSQSTDSQMSKKRRM